MHMNIIYNPYLPAEGKKHCRCWNPRHLLP